MAGMVPGTSRHARCADRAPWRRRRRRCRRHRCRSRVSRRFDVDARDPEELAMATDDRHLHRLPTRGDPVPGRSRREQRPRLVHAAQGRLRAAAQGAARGAVRGPRRGFRARGIPLGRPDPSPFRIYRDVRFSKDKSPYKTNVAASFPWTEGGGGWAARLRRERQPGRLLPLVAGRGVHRRRDVAPADGQARGLPQRGRRRPEGASAACSTIRSSRRRSGRSRATS